jgi:deferrochelatase/peroxidase EfeB
VGGGAPRAAGAHPAGNAGRQRAHLVLAAFDVTARDPAPLLAAWAAAPAEPREWDATVGVGPSLFDDRFGLADLRPAKLYRLAPFPGDALEPERSDGDLLVMVAADLPGALGAVIAVPAS